MVGEEKTIVIAFVLMLIVGIVAGTLPIKPLEVLGKPSSMNMMTQQDICEELGFIWIGDRYYEGFSIPSHVGCVSSYKQYENGAFSYIPENYKIEEFVWNNGCEQTLDRFLCKIEEDIKVSLECGLLNDWSTSISGFLKWNPKTFDYEIEDGIMIQSIKQIEFDKVDEIAKEKDRQKIKKLEKR